MHGVAEISPKEIAHVFKILDDQRLVETIVFTQVRGDVRREFRVGERFSGHQTHQEEDDRHQHEEGQDRRDDPFDDISRHISLQEKIAVCWKAPGFVPGLPCRCLTKNVLRNKRIAPR